MYDLDGSESAAQQLRAHSALFSSLGQKSQSSGILAAKALDRLAYHLAWTPALNSWLLGEGASREGKQLARVHEHRSIQVLQLDWPMSNNHCQCVTSL